jgi:beta-alanine degradation protein BauB
MPEPRETPGAADPAVRVPENTASDLAAVPTVQIDNDRVRVTAWRFAPGAATGWHRHELDYVVVPLSTGRLASRTADGMTTADLVTGQAYFRTRGVEHDVVNVNPHEFAFVEVEIRQP